jgi:uncharacterized protein (TIGR00725 family)
LRHPIYISVIGGDCDHTTAEGLEIAEAVGRGVAEAGCVLVNGGMGGTMEFSAKGAKSAGGTTIGILSSTDRTSANRYIDYAIPTPLGYVRNVLVANASDAVVVLPGKWGTSNELSFAMIAGVPVVAIDGWESELRDDGGKSRFAEVVYARDASEAVETAVELARRRRG